MRLNIRRQSRAAGPQPASTRAVRWTLLLLGVMAILAACWFEKDPVELWYFRRGPLEDLESYAAHRPDSAEAALALGKAYIQSGRVRDAVDHLDPMVARYPNHSGLRALQAMALLGAGETERGYAALDVAVHRLGAHDPDTLVLLAMVEQRAGNKVEARTQYQLALKGNPRHVTALLALGQMADESGQFPEALDDFQHAAAVAPRSAAAAAGIAGDDFHLGRLDEAVAQARRALTLTPNDHNANLWLGRSLQALDVQRYGVEAEAAYRRAIAASDERYQDRFYLGQLLRLEGRMPEAAAAQEAVLKENMFHTPAYYELGLCARALGQTSRAAKALTQFKRLNKIDLETTHLEYQLSLKPDDLSLRLKLASYYFETGRPGMAGPEVVTVLQKRPADPEALRLLAKIKARPRPWL